MANSDLQTDLGGRVTLAKQYSTLHGRIVPFFPALAAGTGGILAYLAQVSRPEKPEKFRLYAGAAVAVFSLIPFNIFALKPTVDEINKRAESKVEMATAKESTHQLVDRWGTLNLVNAGLAGISALLAAWAAMVDVEVMPLEAVRLTAGADRMS